MKKILLLTIAVILLSSCAEKKQIDIKTVSDLENKTIGCQAGTTGELYIQNNIKSANLKSFKSTIDAAMSLKNGAIDAIILDELPAKAIVQKNEDLEIVNDTFSLEEYAIAVKKGNTQLLSSINATIKKLKDDKSFERIKQSFMPLDGSIVLPDEIVTEGNEVVKLGLESSFKPFEYIENKNVVGFDVTLGQFIARDMGKKLQVVDMNFDALIAALQSGAIDFIASGMTATEERKQNVDFSDPYYKSNQVIIVRKKNQ